MSELIHALDDEDFSTCTRDTVKNYPTLDMGDIRYFNFMELVSLALNTSVDEMRSSKKVPRIVQGFNNTPYIDRIPDDFRDFACDLNRADSEKYALDWFRRCNFGHYRHSFEPLLPSLLQSISDFARKAKLKQRSLYYVQ